MGGLHFNPADIQSVGIGLAAFFATVMMLFVFLSARHERLGRALLVCLAACSVWAWFGFFYHIAPEIALARQMRVLSVIGIVLINITEMYFAATYLAERVALGRAVRAIRNAVYLGGVAFLAVLLSDLFGTRLIVGELRIPPDVALAPEAGPLMAILILFYIVSTSLSGYLLARRARAGKDQTDRRQALLLFIGMTVGLFIGGTRFTPWYGFDFYPLFGDIGFPLFTFAALYTITRYRLLNLEVAAAQLLVFALWSFTFFRILLAPSLSAAIPDIGLFTAALVIGLFLMRSVVKEIQSQRQLAKLLVDQAKSEFITIAAHQLRTPASAIRWSFNLLQEKKSALAPAEQEIVDRGNKAAENMAHIINDLLDMGRMGNGSFRYELASGDIDAMIRSCVALVEPLAAHKQIRITTHIGELPQIRFDESKLGLALQNLIDNAIKYTPTGGTVEIAATRSGSNVHISVHDSGIGFTSEEKKRVFEKFFRGARAVRISPDGSGLGLVIAKTIVEGHGGTLALDSDEDRGATFTITLPTQEATKEL